MQYSDVHPAKEAISICDGQVLGALSLPSLELLFRRISSPSDITRLHRQSTTEPSMQNQNPMVNIEASLSSHELLTHLLFPMPWGTYVHPIVTRVDICCLSSFPVPTGPARPCGGSFDFEAALGLQMRGLLGSEHLRAIQMSLWSCLKHVRGVQRLSLIQTAAATQSTSER